jgi:PAS domain S-box-containing protein
MGKARILIVEEEGNLAREVSRWLKSQGFEIAGSAPDMASALPQAEQLRPDVVFMHISPLDNDEGIKAAQRIRQQLDIPVVYWLADFDQRQLAEATMADPFGYFIMPFQDQDLQTAISAARGRQQVEKTLRSSELKYQTLFTKANDAIFLMDEHIFVDCNDKTLEMFGCTREQIIGHPPYEFSPHLQPDGQESFTKAMEKIRATMEGQYFYWKHNRADGTPFDAEVSLNTVQLEGKRHIQAIVRDITKRVQADAALRISEDNLREAQTVARLGHYVYDVQNDSWVSSEILNGIFGIGEDFDRTAAGWLKIVHPEHREMMRDYLLQSVLGDGKPFDKEYKIISLDERKSKWVHGVGRLDLDESGRPIKMIGTIQDITERKKADLRLAKLNECLLGFGSKPLDNINHLTACCGELLEADSALYNRLEKGLLCTWGQWHTPPDFKTKDAPEGHLCYDVVCDPSDEVHVIRDLGHSRYAQTDPNVSAYQLQTYVGKAVKFQRRHIGTLCAVFQRDYQPTEDDLRLMNVIASAIGVEEERRQAEEELTTLRLGIEHSDQAIFITDLDGNIVDVNPAFQRIYGYTREETLGQTPRILKSGVHPQDVYERFWKTLLSKQSIQGEIVNKTKDGRLITIDATANPILDERGEIIGFMGIQSDITERKQAEDNLRENEQFLSSIFAGIQDGISVLDAEMNIVRVNATMQEWYAQALPLIGKKCYEAYRGSSQPCQVCPVQKTLQTREAAHEVVPLANADKETVGWLDLFSFPLMDENTGQVRGVIEYVRDITERRRVEQVRDVLYQIGDHVSTTDNLDDLLRRIHESIGSIMSAKNCYIALYDPETETVSFPFFVDEFDPAPAPRAQRRGFTEYVLRTGKPLLLTPDLYHELVDRGEVEPIGTPPISWLGTPLFIEGKPIGALVVQSYEPGLTYTGRNQEFLTAIGHHAAVAIERKRKDDALKLSEEKHRLLIENIQDGVFVIQDNRVQFANEAFARILGFEIPEIIAKDIRDLIAPEDLEMVLDRHRRRMAGEDSPTEYEFRGLHKDSFTRVYLNMTVALITYRGRPAAMGTLKDVSERKKAEREKETIQSINQLLLGELDAERALQGLSNELQELMPHHAAAMSVIHRETDQVEYVISAISSGAPNKSSENYANHYAEPYPGSLTQLILYEKRGALQDNLEFGGTKFEQHLSELGMRSFVAVPLINSGVPLGMLFLASARPGSFAAKHLQTLQLIQSQLALYVQHHRLIERMLDSETKYRTLFENSNDVIYILQDRRFVFVNRKFEELLEYRLEEVSQPDFDFLKLVAPVSMPLIQDRAKRLAAGEKLPPRYEFKGLTRSGHEIDFDVNVSYVIFEGKPAVQGILRDISERKRFEARQQEMQLELIQHAKLSSIGMLATGIAHNMNLPLQGIINHIELLKMTRTDVPYLEDMLNQAQRIAAIINNMLFKSRQEQDQALRELDLNQLLVEELTFLNADLEFKHRVIKEYQFDPNLPKIQGIYSDFSQALLNVIRNALDAMHESHEKRLGVRTRAVPGGEIMVEVADTGCGIDSEHLDRIFNPFFTTKPSAGKQNGHEPAGTGLGLSSAYQLLKKYGARYDVKSEPGDGTVFRVFIPCATHSTLAGAEEMPAEAR